MITDILLDAGYRASHVSRADADGRLVLSQDLALVVCSLAPGASRAHASETVCLVRQWTMAPILACTTDHQDGEATPADFGVEALLTMPFEIDDFIGLVRRFVPSIERPRPVPGPAAA